MKIRSVLYALGARDIAVFNPALLGENVICMQMDSKAVRIPSGSETLTLVSSASFPRYRHRDASGMLLVFVDGEIPQELAHPSPSTIVCNSRYDFYTAQRRFIELIRDEGRLESDKSRMMDIFLRTYNIQQFTQGVYTLIDNPIIVVDTDERILATAGDFTSRRDFGAQMSRGYTLEETVAQMKEDGVVEAARRFRAPYVSRNPRLSENNLWVTTIIYYKGLELGRFDVMGANHSFSAHDFELIDLAQTLAGIILDRADHTASYRNQGASVLNDLLDNKFMERESATRLLRDTGFQDTGLYSLGMVVGEEEYNTPGFNAHIGRIISEAMPQIAWVARESQVTFLLPIEQTGTAGYSAYRVLKEHVQKNSTFMSTVRNNSLFVAFSDPFENILNCSDAYRIVQSLVATRRSKGNVVFYWEHRYELLARMFGKDHNITAILDKRVLAVARYDKAHKTDYLKTLRMYVAYAGNAKEISERLNIHRNTYSYRMKKLQDTFYLDLSSSADMLDTAFTIRVLDTNPQIVP